MRNFLNMMNETEVSFGHKLTKDKVNYTDHSMGGEKCMNCVHYIQPRQCEIVVGSINPDGWCRYFEEER